MTSAKALSTPAVYYQQLLERYLINLIISTLWAGHRVDRDPCRAWCGVPPTPAAGMMMIVSLWVISKVNRKARSCTLLTLGPAAEWQRSAEEL